MSRRRTSSRDITKNGTDADDRLIGGRGNDKLYGGADDDQLAGGSGNDELHGGSGNDYLVGGSGDDTLYGGEGADTIKAGTGNDTAHFAVGENNGNGDVYDGGAGNDTLVISVSAAQLADPNVVADLRLLLDFISNNNDSAVADGPSLQLQYLNLTVSNWEWVQLVDEQGNAIELPSENNAPTDISLSNTSVEENAAGAIIGDLSTTDADAGDSHTYSVDDARFEVVNGQLKLKDGESLDHEAADSVVVQVTSEDTGGLSYSESFSITVNDINEAPADISLSNASVDENAVGAIIGDLSTADVDAGGSHTYSVDDARFEVVNGQLKLKDGESLDHETADSVVVQVTTEDTGGLSYSESFSITVNDINEAPTDITLSSASVDENAAGAIIGDLTTTDIDAGDSHTYSVDDARFEVVNGQLKLKDGESLDHETEDSVNVQVTSEDSGSLSYSEIFTIAVNDLNEAPTEISLSSASVDENAAGAIIGDLSTTDEDVGDSHTYNVDDARFEVVNGQLKLKDGESLNQTLESSVNLEITTTDAGGLSYSENFIISVGDVNEAPTVSLSVSTATLAENSDTTASVKIADITVTDDTTGNNNLALVGSDKDLFEIVDNNGSSELHLKAGTALDYETQSSFDVSVEVDDITVGGTPDDSASLTLTISDVNETPSDITLSNTSVDENAAGAIIGDLTTSDIDAGDSHTYSVDDARFEVVNGQLKLKDGESLNHEAEDFVVVQVTTEDSGALSYSESFTLTVNDINEAPSDISLSNAFVDENAAGAIIGALSTADVDAGDSHTYSVDDARFEVVNGQLKLKEGESLDYETETSVEVLVTSSDTGSLSVNETFSITVNDINETNSLFTDNADVIKFDDVLASNYTDGTQYDAKDGNDSVTGASSAAEALEAGFDLTQTLNLGEGNDYFSTSSSSATVLDEKVDGGAGNDTMHGFYGNDTLLGGDGADSLYGGAGNDTLDGGSNGAVGTDRVYGDAGDDTATFTVGEVDTNSSAARDIYYGGNTDEVSGDTLIVRVSAAQLADLDILADLFSLKAWVENNEAKDTARSFDAIQLNARQWENIEFRSSENETLIDLVADYTKPALFDDEANNINLNYIVAEEYLDGSQYDALAGNDNISGAQSAANASRAGFDLTQTLNLGEGNDTFAAYTGSAGVLDENVDGGAGNDYLYGYYGDDTLKGDSGDDHINGGAGNDILDGGADYDSVRGDSGDDTATFTVGEVHSNGTTTDIYFGGNGDETVGDKLIVRVSAEQLADAAILSDLISLKAWVENIDSQNTNRQFSAIQLNASQWESIEFLAVEDDSVIDIDAYSRPDLFDETANTVDIDTLIAEEYRPGTQYDALGGNDRVDGAHSAEHAARAGFDLTQTLNLGDGSDSFSAYGNNSSGVDEKVDGGAGNDYLYGYYGNDTLTGGDGADYVIGGSGDDILDGGTNGIGGSDQVQGQGGDDTATFTVGEVHTNGSSLDYYLGGSTEETNGDTLIVRVSAAQLANAEILVDLFALKAWVEQADTKDTSRTFSEIQLNAYQWEQVEFRATEDESIIDMDAIPRPALFDDEVNTVDFDTLSATEYEAGTQYEALAGNDSVTGAHSAEHATRAGFDLTQTLNLGDGNDSFNAHSASTTVLDEKVDGGAGSDTLRGYYGNDTLTGGDGADSLHGGAGDDILDGGTNGTGAYEYVYGEAGDDTATFTVGEVSTANTGYYDDYRGGAGSDTLVVRVSNADLNDAAILLELEELEAQFSGATPEQATLFEDLQLRVQDFELLEIEDYSGNAINLDDY